MRRVPATTFPPFRLSAFQFGAWGRKSTDVKNRTLSCAAAKQVVKEAEVLMAAMGHLLVLSNTVKSIHCKA